MSGYKYSLLNFSFSLPHKFMCICIGLIKVMEKHESGWEKMLVRENHGLDDGMIQNERGKSPGSIMASRINLP